MLLHVIILIIFFPYSYCNSNSNDNKAYLKNRLLENLNNFFPAINSQERLEILTHDNSITDPSPDPFPTLLPPSSDLEELEMATAPSQKIRSEGRITSETSSLNSIRDWRRRLYKAFKNRSKISRIIRKSTYGRDPDGNLVPLFDSSQQSTIEPYPPREIRFAYRTSQTREPVVYLPASSRPQPETIPVPVASYLAQPPSQPVQLHILPPLMPNYQTSTAAAPNFPEEPEEPEEDKCNSQRLKTIILRNIVSGDAEASKRAVQSAAEAETGRFFNAICGTGFFSYIAHTDEFCLASSGGVNCYVYSPVCQISNEVVRN